MEIKIYTLSSTRDPNNIRYVGKSKQKLSRRLSQHLCAAKKARENNYKLNYNYNWINKELSEGYEIIIEELDSANFQENESWEWLEQYWISQIKTWGFNITNLTDGGDGNKNQHFSKETIQKRADKLRGVPRDLETRKKISKSHTGKILSKETKNKVSNSIKELQGRKIIQYDLEGIKLKEWNCIVDAARELKIDKANIGHCCSHKKNHNSAGGFIWRYIEDSTPVIKYTPNSICVLNLNRKLISIFKTAGLASKELGVSACSISNCCNHKIKNVKGYIFVKYKEFMNTQSDPAEMQLA